MESAEFPSGSLNFHTCDFETTLVLCVMSEVMMIALAIRLGLPNPITSPMEVVGPSSKRCVSHKGLLEGVNAQLQYNDSARAGAQFVFSMINTRCS